MKRSQTNVMIVLIAVNLMSGSLGLFSRELGGFGLGPEEISLTRTAVTILGLFILIMATDRSRLRVKPTDLALFALFGMFKLLSDITLFAAQDMIALGLATLLEMTAPIYVLILSHFLFGERITAAKIGLTASAFIGLILICNISIDSLNTMNIGILYGIASGMMFALYMIGDKVSVDRGYDPMSVVFYIFLFSLLFNLPVADVGATLSVFVIPEALGYILVIGILLTLVPFTVDVWAMNCVSPSVVAIFAVLEVITASLIGLAFYGESLSIQNIIGMIIVIMSITLLNIEIPQRKKTE